ncbi:hypothetical protein SD71_01450 [Cohnella kolymensis]|uniref:C4-dicarboxylate ABC transporter substrate-binding protein n=1 Tax=Cohnella kolymensis TaxID=1590652 RepID=A0ABR5A9K5_9BACL|nr:TRAP transporter substrate-binding protein [Cohnella kolymensis]KIL37368.1 hypothetical protein SD71_01450 [Cohnella kolymensis]
MKKKSILILMLIFIIAVVSACGNKQTSGVKGEANAASKNTAANASDKPSYTFKLTTIVQADHPWVKTAEKFNEELNQRSGGRMKLEIFPASQLGKEADMIQQIGAGVVDFGYITTAYMSTRAKSLNAWFMPMLFPNTEAASKMRGTDSATKMLALLEPQGIIGLDWLQTGNHSILMKSGSMETPEAFAGKKIRAPGGTVINDFYSALKASAAPMPLPEVYPALQTGVVDGVNASVDSAWTEKYYEVAKEFTLLNQFSFNAMVVVSKAKLDKLSPEDQQIVKDASKAAIDWGNKYVLDNEKEVLKKLQDGGVKVYEADNKDAFKSVTDEIWAKYSSDPLIKAFIDDATKK